MIWCAAAAVQIAGRLVRQNQDGSLTSARATATRCFGLPTAGRPMSRAIHEPDAPEQLHGSVMTLASRYTGIDERQLTFPAAVNLGRRLKFWNTNPIRLFANPAQLIVIQSPDSRPQNR